MKKIFKTIYNFFFCLKYPFYKCYNVFSGKFLGYTFTRYDDIPYGWRKAFGKQFSKELKNVLKEENFLKEFRFLDIKEKYGALCIYTGPATDKIFALLEKYERMSEDICIKCGKKPAEYQTPGYILNLCKDCMIQEMNLTEANTDIKKYRKKV